MVIAVVTRGKIRKKLSAESSVNAIISLAQDTTHSFVHTTESVSAEFVSVIMAGRDPHVNAVHTVVKVQMGKIAQDMELVTVENASVTQETVSNTEVNSAKNVRGAQHDVTSLRAALSVKLTRPVCIRILKIVKRIAT